MTIMTTTTKETIARIARLPQRLQPLAHYELPDGYKWIVTVPFGWAEGCDLESVAQQACRNAHGMYKPTPSSGHMSVCIAPEAATVYEGVLVCNRKSPDEPIAIKVAEFDYDGVCTTMIEPWLFKIMQDCAAGRR